LPNGTECSSIKINKTNIIIIILGSILQQKYSEGVIVNQKQWRSMGSNPVWLLTFFKISFVFSRKRNQAGLRRLEGEEPK